jgi:hypothetical protein
VHFISLKWEWCLRLWAWYGKESGQVVGIPGRGIRLSIST